MRICLKNETRGEVVRSVEVALSVGQPHDNAHMFRAGVLPSARNRQQGCKRQLIDGLSSLFRDGSLSRPAAMYVPEGVGQRERCDEHHDDDDRCAVNGSRFVLHSGSCAHARDGVKLADRAVALAVHCDFCQCRSIATRWGVLVSRPKPVTAADIRKRTPLEQAIAERTDKRARYLAKKRREGFTQTTLLVRTECLEQVKAYVRQLNDAAPEGGAND